MSHKDNGMDEYVEVFKRPVPYKYDAQAISEEHATFYALLISWWGDLLPVSRDIFTSFSQEFKELLGRADKIEKQKNDEVNTLNNSFQDQIRVKNKEITDMEVSHKAALALLKDENAKLTNEIVEVKEDIISLKSELIEKDEIIAQNNDLIASLKENIADQTDIIKTTTDETEFTKNEIQGFIKRITDYTNALNNLDQELTTAKLERDNAIERNKILKEKINTIENKYLTIIAEKDESLISFKEGIDHIFHSIKQIKAQKKATDKLNIALAQKRDNLEKELNKLRDDYNKSNKLLKRQVKINQSYHALTLKVIEKHKKSKSDEKINSDEDVPVALNEKTTSPIKQEVPKIRAQGSPKEQESPEIEDQGFTEIEDQGFTEIEDQGFTEIEDQRFTEIEDQGFTEIENQGFTEIENQGFTEIEDQGTPKEEEQKVPKIDVDAAVKNKIQQLMKHSNKNESLKSFLKSSVNDIQTISKMPIIIEDDKPEIVDKMLNKIKDVDEQDFEPEFPEVPVDKETSKKKEMA